MILQNIVEYIEIEFPGIGRSQIIKDINRTYKSFVNRTGLIKDTHDVTNDSSTSYSYPSGINEIYGVEFYDSDSNLLEGGLPKYKVDNKIIYFYDYYWCTLSKLPTDIATIKLYTYDEPDDLTLSDEVGIPEQFEDALTYGVLARYYTKYPTLDQVSQDGSVTKIRDLRMRTAMKNDYEEVVRLAKKYVNTNGNQFIIETKQPEI